MNLSTILKSGSPDSAIEAAYLVIRVLKQRVQASTLKTDDFFEISGRPDAATIRNIVHKLVTAMETAEKKPLSKFGRPEYGKYLEQLFAEIEKLRSPSAKSRNSARSTLAKMRANF